MRTHGTLHPTTPDRLAPPAALLFDDPVTAMDIPAFGDRPRHRSHGRAALANALDEGLMPEEVAQILDGRTILEAFPVWRGESPADYAARAVAEMFVVYLR